LHSCIASESQRIYKRVFYLKQINFNTGGPLPAGGLGQLPPLPPTLNPTWHVPIASVLLESLEFKIYVMHE